MTSAQKNGGGANRPPRRAPGGCKQGIPAILQLFHGRPFQCSQQREKQPRNELDETLVERLWGLTEMFPDTVRTAAETSAQCSVSVLKKFYSFSRSALWVGTTSFMILVLPVVFETERLQLEQQQLQQQRQILLGPNTAMSGGMPSMMPAAPSLGKV
ncbi:mitochondrial import receptor subunit TOM22 homolog isoform X1 [Gambusia affinis]|uniref:mitochondrial import receptor subunit TOM22 homolog isoform X1 n=1 Tax=Gambusia affinis TaxID=33528 RepID=UPI000F328740|nr:mitochondrial import receptor subunit TOM22 homolog isoform X1 [Gambusia affinis]